MSLSNEQILLLENLAYLEPGVDSSVRDISGYENRTVGDWLDNVSVDPAYRDYTNGEEWNNILTAARKDPTIMNMKIVDTHIDNAPGGGGGKSVVFVSQEQGEAVVAFKGTAAKEWKDDFIGGNRVSTPQQDNALKWYQDTYRENGLDQYSVTVTGHSKGGNKAKYITVMDDTVDRCVSFDGQGFSDQFIEKYHDQIAVNQGKITNINAEDDYVNILLNDIGKTEFYKAYNTEGDFLQNHCPDAIMDFDEDGNFTLHLSPDGQGKEVKALDEFLNSCIRSMPEEDRDDALMLFGTLMEEKDALGRMSGDEAKDFILDLMTDPQYADNVAYVAAFFLMYEQAHPEFGEEIRDLLGEYGMGEFVQYVDVLDSLVNMEIDLGWFGTLHLNDIIGLAAGIGGALPDWAWDKILDEIEKNTGVRLTVEQVRGLLSIAGMTADYMGKVNVNVSGKDKKVDSVTPGPDKSDFMILPGIAQIAVANMEACARRVLKVADDVDAVVNGLDDRAYGGVRWNIRRYSHQLDATGAVMREMRSSLETIVKKYRQTEQIVQSKR